MPHALLTVIVYCCRLRVRPTNHLYSAGNGNVMMSLSWSIMYDSMIYGMSEIKSHHPTYQAKVTRFYLVVRHMIGENVHLHMAEIRAGVCVATTYNSSSLTVCNIAASDSEALRLHIVAFKIRLQPTSCPPWVNHHRYKFIVTQRFLSSRTGIKFTRPRYLFYSRLVARFQLFGPSKAGTRAEKQFIQRHDRHAPVLSRVF